MATIVSRTGQALMWLKNKTCSYIRILGYYPAVELGCNTPVPQPDIIPYL